jgi:hypothetical protein
MAAVVQDSFQLILCIMHAYITDINEPEVSRANKSRFLVFAAACTVACDDTSRLYITYYISHIWTRTLHVNPDYVSECIIAISHENFTLLVACNLSRLQSLRFVCAMQCDNDITYYVVDAKCS